MLATDVPSVCDATTTTLPHEANPLSRFGDHTSAGKPLRSSLLSIRFEISRSVRRSNFASSMKPMQLPRIGDRVSRATKGEFPARVFRGETNNLDSLWRIAEHSLNLSLNYSGFESSGTQGARARRAKSARRNVRRFCDPSGYASQVFLHFRHKRKRYPPRSSGVGTASEGMSRTHNVNSMMESSIVSALHLSFVRSWPTCRSSKSRLGCDRSGSESD